MKAGDQKLVPCTCNEFIDGDGIGACQKRDVNFNGKFSCFVDASSTCIDLMESQSTPGKQLSATACEDKNEGY